MSTTEKSDNELKLGIVFFNEPMFAATGESDKPLIILKLTPEQQEQLSKARKKGYSILSIHPYQE